MNRKEERLIAELDLATNWQTTRDQWQAGQGRKKVTMQPHEELSLLIESVEDDIARAVRTGNVALARQCAQELRTRFFVYRDACADAGIAWAIRSRRTERSS